MVGYDDPIVAILPHFEHDPVPPVITDIHCEQFFMKAVDLSEIEFPESSFHFEEFGKLDITVELDDHNLGIAFLQSIFVLYFDKEI